MSLLNQTIIEAITGAEAKALATSGPEGLNVVPVSVVELHGNAIHLFDFFMDKTVKNLLVEPTVALTAWAGLSGVQVRATATYSVDGEIFTAAEVKMKEQFPERTLRGVIILMPTAVYDISAGAEAGKQLG